MTILYIFVNNGLTQLLVARFYEMSHVMEVIEVLKLQTRFSGRKG